MTNQAFYRLETLLAAGFCVVGLLTLDSTPARAQNIGDWETVPGLTNGFWDNSTNNSVGNSNTWQMWTGTSWTVESGNVAGAGYPNNNTGVITILSGTTITNAVASSSTITADGITVQSNASLEIFKSTFTLNSTGAFPIDLDVFGTLGFEDTTAAGFSMNAGATIVVESGGTMTNFGSTSGDVFAGPGYGVVPVSYVSGAITFRSNSMFVLAAITNKGTIPRATWEAGSTCLIAPVSTNTTNFIPSGLGGQVFYNLIWDWPTSNGKNGGAAEGGTFTINGNFAMTANPARTVTNEDFPFSGNTMTVGGNLGITNVTWFPTASAGTVTLVVGGNYSIDSTASIGMNNNTAIGCLIFNGASPQTFTMAGADTSPANWNYGISNGATVNLATSLTINGNGAGLTGFVTNSGTLVLNTGATLSGTSNTMMLAQGATFNISQGTYTFAAEDTLEGAGTVIGNVTAGSTSVIYPGLGLPLTIQGGLTYGSAASTNIFNLTSSTSSGNDQIVVTGGNVTANGAQVVINPLSTLATSDYVLLNVTGGGTIAGSFNATPAWVGTPPANSSSYSIVTTSTQVLLHFGTVVVPQPVFTGISISGNNLLVNGSNGVAGSYVLLTSTNLASKVWTPVSTNTLSGAGNFSFTASNAVIPGSAQQFYILKAP